MKILSWSHHSLLHLLFNYPCLISNRSDHFRPVILHLSVLSVLLPLANYLMPHLPAHLPLITPLPPVHICLPFSLSSLPGHLLCLSGPAFCFCLPPCLVGDTLPVHELLPACLCSLNFTLNIDRIQLVLMMLHLSEIFCSQMWQFGKKGYAHTVSKMKYTGFILWGRWLWSADFMGIYFMH